MIYNSLALLSSLPCHFLSFLAHPSFSPCELMSCVCVCHVCVSTEQHEHLESTCPTHTLKTETDQVSVSAILPFVHTFCGHDSTCFTSFTVEMPRCDH